MQSTGYGTRNVHMPDRRSKIAEEACQWATLRYSNKMVALKPHVGGLVVDKEPPGQLLVIAQIVRTHRKTKMPNKPVEIVKIQHLIVEPVYNYTVSYNLMCLKERTLQALARCP